MGAPYGGPDGRGAVFIYHGFGVRTGDFRDKEKEKPAQVIYDDLASILVLRHYGFKDFVSGEERNLYSFKDMSLFLTI